MYLRQERFKHASFFNEGHLFVIFLCPKVSWLLSLNGRKFVMPQEVTNANAVCMDISKWLSLFNGNAAQLKTKGMSETLPI